VTATGVVINGKIGNSVAWSKCFAPLVKCITTAGGIIATLIWFCCVPVWEVILLLRRDFKLFLWAAAIYFPYLLFYKFTSPYFVSF
jgi:hypothetical protein